jgi:hypothetical protein
MATSASLKQLKRFESQQHERGPQVSANPTAREGPQPLTEGKTEQSALGGLVKGAVKDALKAGVQEATVPGRGTAKKVKKDVSGMMRGSSAKKAGQEAGEGAATPGGTQPSQQGGASNRSEALFNIGTIASLVAGGIAGSAGAGAAATPGAAAGGGKALALSGGAGKSLTFSPTPTATGMFPATAGAVPKITPAPMIDVSVPASITTSPASVGAGAMKTVNPATFGQKAADFGRGVAGSAVDAGLGKVGLSRDIINRFNTGDRLGAGARMAGNLLSSRQGKPNPGGAAPALPREEGLPPRRTSGSANLGTIGNARFNRRRR